MTLEEIRSKALEMAEPEFKKFEPIALANTKKVLEAFKECQVSDYHFTGTTGYGYNDVGREKLDEVFAYVFKGEKAIVRPHFVSGTHALATTLISLMGNGSKGTEFIYAVGAPYDTMQSVIGASREVRGSLVEKGFTYTEVPLKDNTYDVEAIANAVNDNTRVVVIQRSRGYSTREPLSIADIKIIVDAVKAKNSNTICFVDNCYGEFTELQEPLEAGADIIMLDNMSVEEMKEAIRIIDGRAQTECSGNVTKENIDHLTSLGVDYISSGALTHSAPVLDISLKNLHAL